MICYQDNNGDCSLNLARAKNNNIAFDLLLKMAMMSDHTFISRSMLKDLSFVLKNPSTTNIYFLNNLKQSFQQSIGLMEMDDSEEIFLNNCTLLNS